MILVTFFAKTLSSVVHVKGMLLHTTYFNIIKCQIYSYLSNLLQWQCIFLAEQCAMSHCIVWEWFQEHEKNFTVLSATKLPRSQSHCEFLGYVGPTNLFCQTSTT